MSFKRYLGGAATAAVLSLAVAAGASAQTITSASGAFTVGIGANGELFDGNSYIGFLRTADGFDPIAPGTPRDSWGVGIVGGAGAYADGQYFGSGVAGTVLAFGTNNAEAVTDTGIGLTVTQDYSFVNGGNILRIDTLVRNDGTDAVDALFQRNVDWDIDPTAFGENIVGPFGASALVTDSSYNGFESPNPNDGPFLFSCFGGCNATGDLGGGIRISLGTLAGGATSRFSFFYGLNYSGESLNDLVAEGHGAGASYIIGGQSDESGDYPNLGANSAFIGVSGAVPEPATWAMMILGFFGLGSAVRRRRALAA